MTETIFCSEQGPARLKLFTILSDMSKTESQDEIQEDTTSMEEKIEALDELTTPDQKRGT